MSAGQLVVMQVDGVRKEAGDGLKGEVVRVTGFHFIQDNSSLVLVIHELEYLWIGSLLGWEER